MTIRLSQLGHLGRLHGEDVWVQGVQHDSRRVRPGDLFAALRGRRYDGHDFASEAVGRGAVAVMGERLLPLTVPQLVVPDTREALGPVSALVYGEPARALRVVGVTGTNGKTTTTYLLHHLFGPERSGLVGTVEVRVGGRGEPAERTTPEASDLQAYLRRMVDGGVAYAFLEVSSHALSLGRVRAIPFAAGVFTNLTQDHLDFHGTMEAYREAKASLFRSLPAESVAVLNADDATGRQLARETEARVVTYGRDGGDVRAEAVTVGPEGIRYRLASPFGSTALFLPLTGHFNVYNSLAAAATALALGLAPERVAAAMADFAGVPGRFERIDLGQPFLAVVDYAHTPDGLENVLKAARDLVPGRVIAVFGCGGERDRGKRPEMGRIAAELADVVLVTSDNPRGEDPEAIIEEILRGIPQAKRASAVPDRREAIFAAVRLARPGDAVVVAGKGHETYQVFRDRTIRFDDREVLREAIHARAER